LVPQHGPFGQQAPSGQHADFASAFAPQHGPSGQHAPSGQQLAFSAEQHACGGSQQSAPGVQQDSGAARTQHAPPSRHPPDFGAVATWATPTPPTSTTTLNTFVHMIELPSG